MPRKGLKDLMTVVVVLVYLLAICANVLVLLEVVVGEAVHQRVHALSVFAMMGLLVWVFLAPRELTRGG